MLNHGISFSLFESGEDSNIDRNAIRISTSLFGFALTSAFYGDVFFQKTESSLVGFRGGYGEFDRISAGHPSFEHPSASFAQGKTPPNAFYLLKGSYFGDWNTEYNNFMRSALAVPHFGLAAMWTRFTAWRLEGLAMGMNLGQCLLNTVNDEPGQSWNNRREMSLLGDPTLRAQYIQPPSSAWVDTTREPGKVIVRWTGAEVDSNYVVFRASSLTGDFSKLSLTLGSNIRSFTDDTPLTQGICMVRALKTTVSGTGSYANFSQGVFTQ